MSDAIGVVSTYVKTHEKLLIAVFASILIFWGYNKYLDHQVVVDQAKADAATQALNQTKAKADQDAALVAQQNAATQVVIEQYQALALNLSAQNAKLANDIVQRGVQLNTRVKQDASLDTEGRAARLIEVENLPLTSISVSDNLTTLTDPAALQILQDLEAKTVLEQDVRDLNSSLSADQKLINALIDVKNAQGSQIDILVSQVTDLKDALAKSEANTIKQVKLQAAKDKKSRLNWFKGGVVVGLGIGLTIGHFVPGL